MTGGEGVTFALGSQGNESPQQRDNIWQLQSISYFTHFTHRWQENLLKYHWNKPADSHPSFVKHLQTSDRSSASRRVRILLPSHYRTSALLCGKQRQQQQQQHFHFHFHFHCMHHVHPTRMLRRIASVPLQALAQMKIKECLAAIWMQGWTSKLASRASEWWERGTLQQNKEKVRQTTRLPPGRHLWDKNHLLLLLLLLIIIIIIIAVTTSQKENSAFHLLSQLSAQQQQQQQEEEEEQREERKNKKQDTNETRKTQKQQDKSIWNFDLFDSMKHTECGNIIVRFTTDHLTTS